jgi:biotin operon repressor
VEQTRWEPDPQITTNPLEDPVYSYLVETEDGRVAAPSRFCQPPVGKDIDDEDSYVFLADSLVTVAATPLEKTVAGMLLTGHSGNAIARSLKVSRKQITNVIGVLRARVEPRLGIEVEKPVASWMERPAPEEVLDLPVPRSSLAPARDETAKQAVEQMAV